MGDYLKDVKRFLSDYEVEAREAERKSWVAKLRSLGKPDRLITGLWESCLELYAKRPINEAHAFACRVMASAVEINLAKLRGTAQ